MIGLKMKVIICDAIQKACIEILENEGFQVDVKTGLSEEELINAIKGYSAVIVRSATKITSKIIEASDELKYIGRAGSGVDTIDVPAATAKNVIVMNVPAGNTISVAEQTIGLMLSMIRFIPQSCSDLKNGKWEKKKYMGSELYQKTLGIIGLGKIGFEVAKRCQAFEMKVLAFDPVLPAEKAKEMGIDLVSFETVLKESDFISIHTPGGPNTKNLISDKELSLCKEKVFIVNCARGGILNEQDALKYLNSGKISGLALDVFSKEPPDANDALINHPNVVVTPHLGASTKEAQDRVGVAIAHQIADALKGKEIVGAVNKK
jgi:D-3-phosphoglycerate dehydrogenase / 2-oxoglutarate reductase